MGPQTPLSPIVPGSNLAQGVSSLEGVSGARRWGLKHKEKSLRLFPDLEFPVKLKETHLVVS